MITGKIVHFYENDLKEKASVDDNLKYFNVSDLHLNGKSHPVIGGITTTSQAKEIRPLIKMLLNDYYTYEKRSIFSGGTLSPHCRLPECQASGGFVEDVKHILTQCLSTAKVRDNMLTHFHDAIKLSKPNFNFTLFFENKDILAQSILDPLSQNLPSDMRIEAKDDNIENILRVSRQLVNSIHCERLRLLKMIQ